MPGCRVMADDRRHGLRPLAALCGLLLIATAVAFSAAQDVNTAPETVPDHSQKRGAADEKRQSPKAPSPPAGHIDGYLAGGRWREGSKLIDIAGYFKTSGERVAFHAADGKARFACLENLNSERVARIVAESPPDSLEWIVQGTLREFRGENYLLLTQAVIRSRTVRGPRPVVDPSLKLRNTAEPAPH